MGLARPHADGAVPRRARAERHGLLGSPERSVVERLRSRDGRVGVRRPRAVARAARRLREQHLARAAVADLWIVRSYGPAVVLVRLGDPDPRDHAPRRGARPSVGSASARGAAAVAGRDHADALARVPHHVRRGPHQAARRRVLDRADVPRLPLRDAADPQSAVGAVPSPAAPDPRRGRGPQSHRRGRAAVLRVRSAQAAPGRGDRDGAVSRDPRAERQPRVPQLAHARPDPRVLRR